MQSRWTSELSLFTGSVFYMVNEDYKRLAQDLCIEYNIIYINKALRYMQLQYFVMTWRFNMNENSANNKNRNMISPVLIGEVMAFMALLISELYLFNKMPENYLVILGIGIFIIIDVYLFTDEVIKILNKNYKQRMLQIEEYMKSQKAIYLSNKKGFESIIEKLEEVDKNNREAIDSLFTGQKTIGKTIIKKNMESLAEVKTAIQTLNLQMPEQIPDSDGKNDLSNLSMDIERLEQAVVAAIHNTGEEFSQVKNECVSIREVCGVLVEKLDNLNIDEILKQISKPMPEPELEPILEQMPEPELEPIPEQMPEPVLEQPVQENESQDLLEEMGIAISDDFLGSETENELMDQDIFDEESILARLNDSQHEDILGDINLEIEDEIKEADNAEEPKEAERPEEAEKIEEPEESKEAEKIEEPGESKEVEKIEESEKVMEITQQEEMEPEKKQVEGLDLSDPNKQMSPDDIAALIASMQL